MLATTPTVMPNPECLTATINICGFSERQVWKCQIWQPPYQGLGQVGPGLR